MIHNQEILVKSIVISHTLSRLLIEQLDVIVHEMNVSKHPKHGQMVDKFEKVKSSVKNAYQKFDNLVDDDIKALNEMRINEMMDQLWDF